MIRRGNKAPAGQRVSHGRRYPLPLASRTGLARLPSPQKHAFLHHAGYAVGSSGYPSPLSSAGSSSSASGSPVNWSSNTSARSTISSRCLIVSAVVIGHTHMMRGCDRLPAAGHNIQRCTRLAACGRLMLRPRSAECGCALAAIAEMLSESESVVKYSKCLFRRAAGSRPPRRSARRLESDNEVEIRSQKNQAWKWVTSIEL